MTQQSETAGFMAMKGAGYYSKATTGARDAINLAAPTITRAVARMGLKDEGGAFRAADLGCADGGTSIAMWKEVLADIRARIPSRAIEIVYTDLPRNDFSQLFKTVHGQTDIETYYGSIPDLYPFASGTSFHQAIFPRESVDLFFSATATHYISKAPCNITNHVHMVGAKGEERRQWEELGRVEWERLLHLRAREMKLGGRLVFLNFGIDSQGRYLGHTGGVSMFDTFDRLWKELAAEGRISEAEYLGTNFPQVYRTEAQFTAPLRDTSSLGLSGGPAARARRGTASRVPLRGGVRRAQGCGAVRARVYSDAALVERADVCRGACPRSGPKTERQAILDTFFGRYERLVAEKPDGHGMDYIHVLLVATKA